MLSKEEEEVKEEESQVSHFQKPLEERTTRALLEIIFFSFFSFSDVLSQHDFQKCTWLLCYGLSRPSGLTGNDIAEISSHTAAAVIE